MKVGFYEKMKKKAEQKEMNTSEYVRYALRKLWGEI